MRHYYIMFFQVFGFLVSFSQESYQFLYKNAAVLDSQKKYSEALSSLNIIIDDLKIMNDSVFFKRGNVFFEMGELKKAIHDIDLSLEFNSKNDAAHFVKGLIIMAGL